MNAPTTLREIALDDKYTLEHGRAGFDRDRKPFTNHYTSLGYYYVDHPESDLPPIAPLNIRTRNTATSTPPMMKAHFNKFGPLEGAAAECSADASGADEGALRVTPLGATLPAVVLLK